MLFTPEGSWIRALEHEKMQSGEDRLEKNTDQQSQKKKIKKELIW